MATDTRTQHTPGPWISDYGDGEDWGIFSKSDSDAIAYLTEPGSYAPLRPEQAEANARLIAAAPDLLAALEAAATRITRSERYGCMCGETGVQTPCGHCVWTQARAAIAKAKGQ